jgi:hypothetical protein
MTADRPRIFYRRSSASISGFSLFRGDLTPAKNSRGKAAANCDNGIRNSMQRFLKT